MAKILISYRRSDSDVFAGRVHDRIVSRYGEQSVFIDVDNIPFGKDFRVHIQQELAKADAILVIVGPKWLGLAKGGHSRIMEATDPVRIELETALSRGVPTIPILVGNTSMPKPEQLPETLKDFAFLNAAQVDTSRDFHRDLNRVIATLDQVLRLPPDTSDDRERANDDNRAAEAEAQNIAQIVHQTERDRLAKEAEAALRRDDEDRRQKTEAKARQQAEEETRRLEAKRKAEEERRQKQAKAKAEEQARRVEAEARRLDAEAQRRAEQERAEVERRAEEERKRAERQVRLEAEARRKTDEEAKARKAENEKREPPSRSATQVREQLEHVPSEQPKTAAASSTVPWRIVAGGAILAGVIAIVAVWLSGPSVRPQSEPLVTPQPAPLITSQDASAMYTQGQRYDYGWGVPQDYAKARESYEKAAAMGNVNAMFSLGVLYATGLGVTQDNAKAREWYDKAHELYEKAAARGEVNAVFGLPRPMTTFRALSGGGQSVPHAVLGDVFQNHGIPSRPSGWPRPFSATRP